MSNIILIEEQSFIGTYSEFESAYYYKPNGTPFNNEIIFVDFDGVMYECQTHDGNGFDTYGAVFDYSTVSYDWSVYPFHIQSVTDGPEEDYLLILVPDDSEHTVTIYSELPAPVVRDYIDKVDLNGTEYDIKDTTSGYISEIVAGSNVTINLDSEGNPVISSSSGSSITFRRWS